MVMARALKGAEHLEAIISGPTISNLSFADDIAQLAESINDLLEMVSNKSWR